MPLLLPLLLQPHQGATIGGGGGAEEPGRKLEQQLSTLPKAPPPLRASGTGEGGAPARQVSQAAARPAKATSVWGKALSALTALGQHAGSIVRRVKVGHVQGQGSVGVGAGMRR